MSKYCYKSNCLGVGLTALLAIGLPAMGEKSTVTIPQITADYSAGRYLPAMEKCVSMLHAEPNNLEVHYMLGNIFIKLDRLEDAYEEYNFCATRGKGTTTGDTARKAMQKMRDLANQSAEPAGAPTSAQPVQQFPLPPRAQQDSQPQGQPPAAQNQNQNQNQNPNQNQNQPPTRAQRQAAEIKASADRDSAAFIAAKRQTLQGQIKHLNDDAQNAIQQVPRYTYFGKERIRNPDYESSVQAIKDDCAARVKALQDDNEREEAKITDFYRGLSNSYSKAPDNLHSQIDDGRPGHKMVDQDPSIYVQNFGSGRSGAARQAK